MRQYFYYIFIFFLSELLYFSCANIKPPQGGPKDTIPPVLVTSIPANKALNFRDRTIRLTYNEFLKTENLNKELIITPMTDLEYEYKYRKNSIELLFLNPFDDSTTYTLNFQTSIKDITEGNISLENIFTFSTGSFIDSMYITGSASDLFTNKPLKGITIGLYSINDTFNLFKGRPMYFTRSDESGKFRIDNIKVDKYFIQSFKDINENLICDLPKEPYGFRLDTFNLQSNIDSVRIKLQYNDIREPVFQKAVPAGKYFEIGFNKTISEYSIVAMDSTESIYSNMIDKGKGIRFYNTIREDSAGVILSVSDSANNILSDTFYIKFLDTKRKSESFDISIKPPDKENIDPDFHATITFSKPIRFIDTDSMFIRYDSINIDSIKLEKNILVGIGGNSLILSIELNKDLVPSVEPTAENRSPAVTQLQTRGKPVKSADTGGLKLYIGKGSFISIEDDTSRQTILTYKIREQEDFGIIKGTVTTDQKFYSIQLLNKSFEVVSELPSSRQFSFINITPGDYLVRILVDNDGSGKWNPGDFTEGRMPEDVHFYPGILSLRANWELQDINFTF